MRTPVHPVAYIEPDQGLVYAYALDGKGGGRRLDWDGLRAWKTEDGPLWVHLDRTDEQAQAWLTGDTGLDPINAEALLREETRPRVELVGPESVLLLMRALNFNVGADPDDLVSLRIWVEPRRLVTLRHRHVQAARDCRIALDAGRGARSVPELLRLITERINYQFESSIDEMDDSLAVIETRVDEHQRFDHGALTAVRREAVELRRFLAPQRDMLVHLRGLNLVWLFGRHKDAWRELANITTHYVEELDNIRERAAIVNDQLNSQSNQLMNRTIYAMTLMTGLFLPLTFITGLLGINVAGIPQADHPSAFYAVCAFLLVVAGVQLLIFRRLRWL